MSSTNDVIPFLRPERKPILCRLGLHAWSGWMRELRRRRVYDREPGRDGQIKFLLYQWRCCYACGDGDPEWKRENLCGGTLAPFKAVARGFISDDEWKALKEHAIFDLDVGTAMDIADGLTGQTRDAIGPATAVIGWLCRFGIHRYRDSCCVRCRHLGREYRSWDRSLTCQ